MRIGLDMLTIQAAGAENRAVAAYARSLVSALLKLESEHRFLLYAHEEHPREAIPAGPRASLVSTGCGRTPAESSPAQRLTELAESNPDQLDWLVVLDPLEPALGFGPPTRPLSGPRLAALVPDMTPFVVPERDLRDEREAVQGYRALGRLRQYERILTPSRTTRDDVLSRLGIPPERVHVLGSAADAACFEPEPSLPIPLASRSMLHELGIRRAYLLADTGLAGQRNVERMVEAYQNLPERLRLGYQLVFVGPVAPSVIESTRLSAQPSWAGAICFTGAVPEPALRVLLQHCAVFVHPALYAGFVQPIVEAMLCGALVVAGNNSAQVELLGDAGLLADPADPGALGERIARGLDDWPLNQTLRARARERARPLTFENAATRLLEALKPAPQDRRRRIPRLRADHAHPNIARTKPRIAFFAPLPPRISGIADYAIRLLDELQATYAIDLYHGPGYLPDLGLNGHDFFCHDGRLFERNSAVVNYHAVVYQMGNSVPYHGYLYDVLLRHPGVVTLHDFFLSVYPYRGARSGDDVRAAFAREIRHFCPERAGEFLPYLAQWCEEEGGLAAACARRSLYLNRRVFERSLGVAVHSPWCVQQVGVWMPEHLEKTVVIPLGVDCRSRTPAERAAIRARFGLRDDSLIVSSIGFIHPDKLVNEAIAAFQPIAESDPSAIFLCVGDECDGGAARQHSQALGLSGRVRFLGRQPAVDYVDLIAITDIGVNLRRPPTNGETSAALLDLLAAGVATIVIDVATFGDYPDTVVRKVRWDTHGPHELGRALAGLAGDSEARRTLGSAAQRYIRDHHSWSGSAARYVELIERCAALRRGRPLGGGPAYRSFSAGLAKDRS